ncbi:hypothetical protein D9758_000214 [Tetrapyrgos nigripes]|uniref:N-alpha-acetyltransferase 40 n=1 Tax=Tetrapyrgos nigripes TaxID=182062 RepID=A0A8H5H161_9AGAR|nr:hypothetical protein D9758_000214 [Tetrapyrgos nigripes]
MYSKGSAVVERANEATPSDIQAHLIEHPDAYQVGCLSMDELTPSLREKIWTLLQENMFELYTNSSFGWDSDKKQEEIFNSLSRFIIVRQCQDLNQVAAFCTFRFEYEHQVDMIYCYELQVSRSYKRQKLGQYLMNCMSAIGAALKMQQVQLTVFLANTEARAFYRAMGFSLDPTSPDPEEEEDEIDYEILCKSC